MPKCGAKARSGEPCKQNALKGKTRCKFHGGRSTGPPKGSANHKTPGSLYSRFLTSEEKALADVIELGSVDAELRLTRIRLMRALEAEEKTLAQIAAGRAEKALEIESVTTHAVSKSVGSQKDVTKKRRDYAALIDRLTFRIDLLEQRRAALLQSELDASLKRLEIAKRQKEADEDAPEEPVTRIEVVVVGSQPAAT